MTTTVKSWSQKPITCLTIKLGSEKGAHLDQLPRAEGNEDGAAPTMGRELMAPRIDRTTRIVSSITTSHPGKGSAFVDLRNAGNFKSGPLTRASSPGRRRVRTALLPVGPSSSATVSARASPCQHRLYTDVSVSEC